MCGIKTIQAFTYNMDRRKFLKLFSGGALLTTAGLVGCKTETTSTDDSSASLGEIPTDSMTYRTGKHGERVSLLGYGCMRWPTVAGTSARDTDSDIDQEEVNRLVDYAIEHGVNLFDTSPAYCKGFSEKATGIALKRHPRESFYISTKLSNFSPDLWSYKESVAMYHRSFENLQVDTIDFYLLHGIGMGGMEQLQKRYIENGVLDFLLEEREKGHIRNLGFSYHGDAGCFDHLLENNDKYKWDFVLIQHNYVDWNHAKEINPRNTNSEYLYTQLAEHGIPVFVMEPLLGGRLASLNDYSTRQMKQCEPQRSVASWAMRFAGNQPMILSVLSGMTYMEHLQDNLRSFCPHKPLSDEDLLMLEHIAQNYVSYPVIPCTSCQYCMPCPYGIDIPTIFAHYNKSLNQGNIITDTADSNYESARRRFLVAYDRKVPRERQADHCIGCSTCRQHCPQRIDIPRQMRRIDALAEQLRRRK